MFHLQSKVENNETHNSYEPHTLATSGRKQRAKSGLEDDYELAELLEQADRTDAATATEQMQTSFASLSPFTRSRKPRVEVPVVLRVEVDVDLAHRLELMHEIRRMERFRSRRGAAPTTKTVRKLQRRGAILDDSGATLMSSSTSFASLHQHPEEQPPPSVVELENKVARNHPPTPALASATLLPQSETPKDGDDSASKRPGKDEHYFV